MNLDTIQLLTALGTVLAAFAAAIATFYSARQVKALSTQLKQAQDQLELMRTQVEHSKANDMAQLSNQHNWNQLDRFDRLPPFLPSWIGLSERGMAWRVLFFNHLNMIKVVFVDHQSKFVNKEELGSWIWMARYWFQNFWEESPNPEINERRQILSQVLRPEEGYSKEFRVWLVESKIIRHSLVTDL